MAKTLMDKKVNKVAKRLNKQLRADVFGNRFEIRQYKKSKSYCGIEHYQYLLIDNEQPARNEILPWKSGLSIIMFSPLHCVMNRFIVTSDFWEKYYNKNND